MMLEESYINDEATFLEKIADKLNLKDKTKLVFIERFKINNDDLNNSALADVLSSNLSGNTLRDSLKRIFKKLEDEVVILMGRQEIRLILLNSGCVK